MSRKRKEKEGASLSRAGPTPSTGGAPPPPSRRGPSRTLRAGFVAGAAALFLLLQVLRLPDVVEGGKIYFLDPDGFTWLERAERVLEEPGVYVHFHPEDNYPEGYTSHWTQPFHWGLALLSLALRPFCGPGRAALEAAGLWICPLAGALAAALLAAWALRRRSFAFALTALSIFLVNPFVLWTFSLGRPDHQCLLYLFLLGAVLLLLDPPAAERKNRRAPAASALLCAAGIWISVEAIALWALLLGGLLMEAALAPPVKREAALRAAFRWAVTAAAATALFAVVEREGRLLTFIPDSISLGQAGILALAAAGLLPARRAAKTGTPGRGAWLLLVLGPPLLLGGAAAALLFLIPSGPLDPALRGATERWFAENLEFLPALFFVDGRAMLGRLHASLAFTLYALPFLLYGLYRSRGLPARGRWILGAGIAAGSLLTLWQMRWRDLHALLAAPALAFALPALLDRVLPAHAGGGDGGRRRAAGRTLLVLAAAFFLLFPWIRRDLDSFRPGRRPRRDYVAVRRICEALRERDPYRPGAAPEPRRAAAAPPVEAVLAPWDAGPLVRWWSGRPVIAGPYHRDMAGILDTLRAYTCRTPAAFDALARRRGIRYVLRPPLGDPLYDIYTFEKILGVRDPLLSIRREVPVPGGGGAAREYALSPGKTAADLEGVLRKRLEENRWEGWPGLLPVAVPGLSKILPDADSFPYLYRRTAAGAE